MKEAPRRLPIAREPFSVRGRDFVQVTLPDDETPGAVFSVAETIAGRYRVEDLLAVGRSSVLLRASDLRLRRGVVIKTLRSDSLREIPPVADRASVAAGTVRRLRHLLQTERRLLVRLRNDGCNGVPVPADYVYDVNPALEGLVGDEFLIGTEPYLVLQELVGVTLEALLANEFPTGMDERMALEGIAPVVRTLAVLHEPWRLANGRTWHCVYQDLKPANLVVDPLGRLTLLDFGGCQVVVDGVPVLEGAYTHGYCAPECEGPTARVLLPCADVYTIGSTLHHMLSGMDPRDRRGRRPGRGGAPLDSRSLPPRCSPEVRRLLDRCLAPRPSERPADARQVAAALSRMIAP
ncbi:MAG: hypothetical protein JO252_29815 [Planctomycetaceae bacterium]|nr:hypothetical protein [Planctomycetaceae bacterium]